MRSVENAECRKCGVWKMRSVENAECGKCGVEIFFIECNEACVIGGFKLTSLFTFSLIRIRLCVMLVTN